MREIFDHLLLVRDWGSVAELYPTMQPFVQGIGTGCYIPPS
jgi:hypothetical protein